MGASTDQIDRQIRETRERMDENLGVLEERATSNAARYGRVAAIVVAIGAGAGAAYFLYRRLHKPSLKDRLKGMSPENMRELAQELGDRLKSMRETMPAVTVTVNDRGKAEPGTLESILRKVAPAVAGTASTALIEKVTGRGGGAGDEPDGARVRPAFD